MFAIIRGTRTVDIKSGEDLGNGLVYTQDNLNMAGGVLRGNRNGVLGADGGGFVQNGALDLVLDVSDLFDRLLLRQSVQEQVDIRGRGKLLMVEFSQGALRVTEFLRYRHETSDHGASSDHDIAPVNITQGTLGEDTKVGLKVWYG